MLQIAGLFDLIFMQICWNRCKFLATLWTTVNIRCQIHWTKKYPGTQPTLSKPLMWPPGKQHHQWREQSDIRDVHSRKNGQDYPERSQSRLRDRGPFDWSWSVKPILIYWYKDLPSIQKSMDITTENNGFPFKLEAKKPTKIRQTTKKTQ